MAVLSEVHICNLALIKIGQPRINSLSDNTKSALLLNEIFETIRDEVLADHPWNFAIKRAEFSQLVTTPAYEYAYEYQIPSDCLRVWRPEDENIEFREEDGKIVTNEGTFRCQYIARVTNVAKFSHAFAQALAFRLAAEVAYAIVNSAQLQQTMMLAYKERLATARSNDAQTGTPETVVQTNFLESRY